MYRIVRNFRYQASYFRGLILLYAQNVIIVAYYLDFHFNENNTLTKIKPNEKFLLYGNTVR